MEPKHEAGQAKLSELLETFYAFDPKYTGYLRKNDILPAFNHLGCKVSETEVDEALGAAGIDENTDELSLNDFKRVYQEVCKHDPRRTTIENVSSKPTIYHYGTSGGHVDDDTFHSISEEEQLAFSSWIERNLKEDKHCVSYFPFDVDGSDLYTKCSDGVLLCKTINCSVPETIDQRALNLNKNLTTFQMHENITLALNSARAIGCNVVNIGASDILNGTKHLLLGLLWQIIKMGLLKQINVVAHAELATLLEGEETISDFAKLGPEDILIRWVNYHLKGSESDTRMHNFTADIRNCEVYAHLVDKIAPQEKKSAMHSTKAILDAVDLVQRAEMVLQNAEQLDCRVFVRPQDIVSGSQRLNLAFLANLFHGFPALEKPPDVEEKVAEIEETREEKTYRNWINSMGIVPIVNHLFSDLTDGIILLKLFDLVKKNSVDWSQVHVELCPVVARANFQRLENCNFAVTLGRESGFSLVGLGGEDICEGKPMMTLALLWQLMRAYTLSLLTRLTEASARKSTDANSLPSKPIAETEIIEWANEKLRISGKSTRVSTTQGFLDPSLASGNLIIDLIDAIRPGSVNYNVVLSGRTKQEQLANAQYAIPLARRIGATVYAVPEDIVEMKSKMIMTIFACLMAVDIESLDYRKSLNKKKSTVESTAATTVGSELPIKSNGVKEAVNSYLYTGITPTPSNNLKSTCKEQKEEIKVERNSVQKLEISRPPPDKMYVKTYNFTVSNYAAKDNNRGSILFTNLGGAGDSVANDTENHVQSSRPLSKYRPRFLSPAGTKTSQSPNCKLPIEGSHSAVREWTVVERPKSARKSDLSRSVPLINILDENAMFFTDIDDELINSSKLLKVNANQPVLEHTIKMDMGAGKTYSTVFTTSLKGKTEQCLDQSSKNMDKLEEKRLTWKQEIRSYHSHGGGRMFLATKCKK